MNYDLSDMYIATFISNIKEYDYSNTKAFQMNLTLLNKARNWGIEEASAADKAWKIVYGSLDNT